MGRLGATFLLDLSRRLSRAEKQLILLLIDSALAPLAWLSVTGLPQVWVFWMQAPFGLVLELSLLSLTGGVASYFVGVHRIKLKSFDFAGVLKTGLVALFAAGTMGLVRNVVLAQGTFSDLLSFAVVYPLLMSGFRQALLGLYLAVLRNGKVIRNVVIYGAGETGMQLAAALRSHDTIRVVAFVDDSAQVQGQTIVGLRVYAPVQIDRLATKYRVSRVLLALPSTSSARLTNIARDLSAKGFDVHRLPSFAQLIGEEAIVDALEPVPTGAILGRDPVHVLQPDAAHAYQDKVVLVTGAGGSVGSELCRHLLRYRPKTLILFEMCELALYTVHRELVAQGDLGAIEIVPILGSVTDPRLVQRLFAEAAVDVVLHAAAYKHVPLVEANPMAGLVNNVFGTRTLAEAAVEASVRRFILVSTDKAVRPTNVMGASKRLAELVVQDMATRARNTDFSIVRFGNVLGSSGSVVPLFKEQIARGGPVTLTHEDVTRYFMTIAEAADLVLIAGALPKSRGPHAGDLFVLDMGRPVRIRDLAERMIRSSGLRVKTADDPAGDIEIVVTGLRPGEKLHEELLIAPGMLATPHEKILRAQENGISTMEMARALQDLRRAEAMGDVPAALSVVQRHVEGFAGQIGNTQRCA